MMIWIWLGAIVLFGAVEAMTAGLVSIWFVAGAAAALLAALALVDPEQVVSPAPDMGSEDFAVFGQEVPSFFYWLGSGFPGQFNPCWHNEHFRTDDSALPLAAALLAQSALVGLEA